MCFSAYVLVLVTYLDTMVKYVTTYTLPIYFGSQSRGCNSHGGEGMAVNVVYMADQTQRTGNIIVYLAGPRPMRMAPLTFRVGCLSLISLCVHTLKDLREGLL